MAVIESCLACKFCRLRGQAKLIPCFSLNDMKKTMECYMRKTYFSAYRTKRNSHGHELRYVRDNPSKFILSKNDDFVFMPNSTHPTPKWMKIRLRVNFFFLPIPISFLYSTRAAVEKPKVVLWSVHRIFPLSI